MSNFTDSLLVNHLGAKHEFKGMWELQRDLVYFIGEEGSCERVTLKAGFITDGGSYSDWIVPLIGSQTGDFFESYALHDGLARRPDLVTWAKFNKVLYEALAIQGMSSARIRRVRMGLFFGSPTKEPKLLHNALEFVELDTVEVIRTVIEDVAK